MNMNAKQAMRIVYTVCLMEEAVDDVKTDIIEMGTIVNDVKKDVINVTIMQHVCYVMMNLI